MFYLPKQRAYLSHESKIAPGAIFTSEGQAAVRAKGATFQGVMPSTGTAADIFVGFAWAGTSAAPFREDFAVKVESFRVPTSGVVRLSRTPIANQLIVRNDADGTVVTGYTLAGTVLSGLPQGEDLSVTYKYVNTELEAVVAQGNVVPGGYIGSQIGQIGLVTRGVVYTSNFDTGVDWATEGDAIVLGANGQLTVAANSPTGVAIRGFVIELPSVDQPLIGIEFDIL